MLIAPGHEQYTRNMATGASNCDLAIVLIDATRGIQRQTSRNSLIVSLLGIEHIIVAINKMDLVGYSQDTFNAICKEYLEIAGKLKLTRKNIHFVPISALKGEMIVHKGNNMSWHKGDTLLNLLETIPIPTTTIRDGRAPENSSVRFPVQYVNRPDANFRGLCGTLRNGRLSLGDKITVLPSDEEATVKQIFNGFNEVKEARAGDAITIVLDRDIDVSRGDMIVAGSKLPSVGKDFHADVVWMTDDPLTTNKSYLFKVGLQTSLGKLARTEKIINKINITTFKRHDADELQLNEVGECYFSLDKPVIFDNYNQYTRHTGSFIIIDPSSNITVGAGMMTGLAEGGVIASNIPSMPWRCSIGNQIDRRRETLEKIEKTRRSRLCRFSWAGSQLNITPPLPNNAAGLYWIYTSYSIEDLQQEFSVKNEGAIDISSLAEWHEGLDNICKIKEGEFMLVYSGRANNLNSRIRQHINGGAGTGSLAIRRSPFYDITKWRLSYLVMEYNDAEDKKPDIDLSYAHYAETLERIWRLQYGWPLLCQR